MNVSEAHRLNRNAVREWANELNSKSRNSPRMESTEQSGKKDNVINRK